MLAGPFARTFPKADFWVSNPNPNPKPKPNPAPKPNPQPSLTLSLSLSLTLTLTKADFWVSDKQYAFPLNLPASWLGLPGKINVLPTSSEGGAPLPGPNPSP